MSAESSNRDRLSYLGVKAEMRSVPFVRLQSTGSIGSYGSWFEGVYGVSSGSDTEETAEKTYT
jgi:hypothetical protein